MGWRATPVICENCERSFLPKRYDARFCSKSCAWATTKGPEFNARIARESAEKRGNSQRGKGKRWYIKRNGRHEHRVVAEEKIGRPLLPGEIVHHDDENKRNNHPDNLIVMTQSEHIRLHKPSRWK